MVHRSTFNCKVITPLLLYGADGETPELRPPAIKGVMRFWWRAINGDTGVKKLRKGEGAIFGGIGKGQGQSAFSIFIRPVELRVSEYRPLPHHTGDSNCPHLPSCENRRRRDGKCAKGFPKRGFSPDSTFEVILVSKKSRRAKPNEKFGLAKTLFEITCLLGGFGNRSRRGFGNVSIAGLKPSMELICDKLNSICMDKVFKFDETNCIITSPFPPKTDYPAIKRVQLGLKPYRTYSELLKKIGNATHTYNPTGSNALGKVRGGRLASPIYVSVLKIDEEYRPIVTTLNIDRNDKQTKFIREICNC